MNVVSGIILGIFAICILADTIRGLFRSILSVASLVVSVALAIYVSPYVSGMIQERTTYDEKLAEVIANEMKFSQNDKVESRSEQVAAVNGLALPEHIKTSIVDNNNSEIYDLLDVSGVYDYVAKSVAIVIINAAVFLLLALMCKITFFILIHNTNSFTKLPIVRSIDKIGGGVLGALKALIYTWGFLVVVSITSTTEWSQQILAQIDATPILKLLYENNILLDIVGDFTKVLFR